MFPKASISKKSMAITTTEEAKQQSKEKSEGEIILLEDRNADNNPDLVSKKTTRLVGMPNQLDMYNQSSIHLISKNQSPKKG